LCPQNSSDSGVFGSTQDKPNWWILVLASPVFPCIVEVKVHLPGIGVSELAEFEIDQQQAAQAPVIENQVHPIPFITDTQPLLSSPKGEIASQFKQKSLQAMNKCLFQVTLRILILETKEFEHIRFLNLLSRGDPIFRVGLDALFQHRGFVPG
jgi:hypothetical protein